MNNILIISGGDINKLQLTEVMKETDFETIIAVDKGLEVLDKLNILPDYIIGDFDSVNEKVLEKYENRNVIIHKLEPEKDYTDTHVALRLGIELCEGEIVIMGGIGSRVDHMISNIHIMKEVLEKNVTCKMLDEHNEIIVIDKDTEIKKDDKYKYISLIPLTTEVTGVTLLGFKYNLENSTLRVGQSIGISNELTGETPKIMLKEGKLIIVKSKD